MANEQIVNAGFLYINELKISNDATTPASIIDIALGICRDSTNVYDMSLPAATTINTAINGIGGLDTGSIAANTLYAIYLISDPIAGNPTGCIASLSLINPLMPFNYAAFRLIGYFATDGSKNILKGYYAGNNNSRLCMYDAPQALTLASSGAATTYTAVALTTLVPAVNNLPVWFSASFLPGNAAGDTMKLQPGNATGDAIIITGQVTTVHVTQNVLVESQLITGVPTVNYKVTNAGDTAALSVAGFQFYI